jgi:hypothetical protein
MADQSESAAVRRNAPDLNKHADPFQQWILQHRLRYVLAAAIFGLLALTLKDWLSEGWRSLHDDIALSASTYTIRSDIAAVSASLNNLLENSHKCAHGGGINGIPNPPELYRNPDCDDLIHGVKMQVSSLRYSLEMDYELAAHAKIPAGVELTAADENLKKVENNLATLSRIIQTARTIPTSADPLIGLGEAMDNFSSVRSQVNAADQVTLGRAKERDEGVGKILAGSRYIAGIFFALAAILGLIGKRYGIEASAEPA